jgi:hypothetical protein
MNVPAVQSIGGVRRALRRDGVAAVPARAPMWLICAAVLLLLNGPHAQGRAFTARLTPLAVDTLTVRTIVGSGSATAVLEDNTLIITGKFEGMNSPATIARLHRAPKGLRGPNVFDLTITRASSGTFEGKLKLTPTQIADLERGWYYLQIHSERHADGQLRGWLLN